MSNLYEDIIALMILVLAFAIAICVANHLSLALVPFIIGAFIAYSYRDKLIDNY